MSSQHTTLVLVRNGRFLFSAYTLHPEESAGVELIVRTLRLMHCWVYHQTGSCSGVGGRTWVGFTGDEYGDLDMPGDPASIVLI